LLVFSKKNCECASQHLFVFLAPGPSYDCLSSANIVSLFEKYKVPLEADYVSIDIDSTDLWVFRAILASKKFRPRVFSVEYNANLAIGDFRTFPDDPSLRWMDDTVCARVCVCVGFVFHKRDGLIIVR
jgi:hypothetical protein